MTTDNQLQTEVKDTVSVEELRQRELADLVEDQRLDLISDFTLDDREPGDMPVTLDPLVAYAREGYRMAHAGPRRRMTADDLDLR